VEVTPASEPTATLFVNSRLTGAGVLVFAHDGHEVEIELAARYCRLLVVLHDASREDRHKKVPGFRAAAEILSMLARLPGSAGKTQPAEVPGKIFGLRRAIDAALVDNGLPPISRDAFIETRAGWGYRLSLRFEVVGWPGDDE